MNHDIPNMPPMCHHDNSHLVSCCICLLVGGHLHTHFLPSCVPFGLVREPRMLTTVWGTKAKAGMFRSAPMIMETTPKIHSLSSTDPSDPSDPIAWHGVIGPCQKRGSRGGAIRPYPREVYRSECRRRPISERTKKSPETTGNHRF